ncbi:CBO0543 family protein [Paenibacillus hamazuiensis]|uniref:CBO0543 family protein n=1 Tax=Paenibacillus hamazuiensis TaxID=2936508 RepID=UPI00200D3F57|nr:CBO0543 family protein [Paenibacillus hamazuiensis]
MEFIFLLGLSGWIFTSWKWADWSRFVEFRASIYIVIVGDFLYNVLTESRHLWTFESPFLHFSHNIWDIMIAFSSFPFVVMLFLSHYPEGSLFKQAMYNLFWACIYSSHELIASWVDIFDYHHGWNMEWSFVLNLIMFPYIRLHQTKPLMAIIIFFICTLMLSIIFQLPIVFEANLPADR